MGSQVLTATSVVQVSGADRVADVRLSDGGRIPADVVGVGIGAIPNTDIAERAGLQCVDELGRASDPCIFAAGDYAMHPNPYAKGFFASNPSENAIDRAKAIAERHP